MYHTNYFILFNAEINCHKNHVTYMYIPSKWYQQFNYTTIYEVLYQITD